MPVYPTSRGGQAVVPCSHCNAGDNGPEPGICHRNTFQNNTIESVACSKCSQAKGLLDSIIVGATGVGRQIPCRQCEGKGYRRV